jgi:two-component system, OmpR family, heavy metal sensor histidine kinase CusS
MYSKSADNSDTGSDSLPPRPGLSLTLWFALSNSIAAFVILSLIALLLYFGLASQLEDQNHRYLHDEVRLLESMISFDQVQALKQEVNLDQHGEEYVKHYIRVLDHNEQAVVETAGMAEAAPHSMFNTGVRKHFDIQDRTWRNQSGEVIVGVAVPVQLGKGKADGILEVALDVTNVNQILDAYRLKIYGVLLLGSLLCTAVSFSIARKGTSPLREITTMVRRITASNLSERISPSGWPAEIVGLADAMNLMLDRLGDSFSRLYNSATNLSHKMRTPLTIMRGEAEVALSRDRSVEELQDVLASNLEENNRLLRLIESILFLANAETGKFNPNPVPLDLREELEKVVDFYVPCAEEKGISITCDGEAVAVVDAPLFRKTAAALLSNAVTYNAPGGTVDLLLRQGEAMSAEMVVTDSGCGIPPAEHEKIFDRFYRIYGTRHMDPHGTGLGLPIVKAAMDLHGGSVKVESAPGFGTTVTVRFPASP